MPKPKKTDEDWEAIMNGNRIGIGQVFRSIRAGTVDEDELDKLFNFAQFSLALMEICGPDKWAMAKLKAELMHYLKEDKP